MYKNHDSENSTTENNITEKHTHQKLSNASLTKSKSFENNVIENKNNNLEIANNFIDLNSQNQLSLDEKQSII